MSVQCKMLQPGSSKRCDLVVSHAGQHETWLTPGRTRNYWTGDSWPVSYRIISEAEKRTCKEAYWAAQEASFDE